MDKILLRSDQNEIAILTLNSPTNLNALSDAMLDELKLTFEEIEQSKDIKAVIIKAAGRAFCPGHDLKEMQEKRDLENDDGKAYFEKLLSKCTHVMKLIREIPQPVIAEVHGVAAAAGCQLVATCDIAIASEDASFGVNGVDIGLFCSTPMVALSRNISRKKAFEMLTTGDFLDPFQAEKLGLINRVANSKDLSDTSLEIAKKIASKLSLAVKIGKKAFYKQAEMEINEAYSYASSVIVENLLYKETKQGMNDFLNKKN
ncbi:MAG: enoyl-CoA hydratase [Paracoccaceae bacterium]